MKSIYDLAWCAPDAPYTAAEISERIRRFSGQEITPAKCQAMMDEFWNRLDEAKRR